MTMTPRARLLTAFSHRVADRVPIELQIDPRAYALPEAAPLVDFIRNGADNVMPVLAGIDFGFMGIPGRYREEVIEDRPGEYVRKRRTWDTAAGLFVAVTRHFYPHLDSSDYQWERRFIDTVDDMARLAEGPRPALCFSKATWDAGVAKVGERGMPLLNLLHPLGTLVRQSNMMEVYAWFLEESALMHRFLERSNAQLAGLVLNLGRAGLQPWFGVTAHEMLIPPWMGMAQFDEWVYPYDRAVNDAIHRIGGTLRAHCHGNCMAFLERMSEMGIDAIEPLEPPPFGDVNLAEAKRRVGDRMVLSGNVPSQHFDRLDPDDVRALVRQAIADGAAGGGFTLRTTGGWAGVNAHLDTEVLRRIIRNVEAFVEAGLAYGGEGQGASV